jgi:hypothetical protein
VDEVHVGYWKDESAAQPVHLGWCAGGFQVLYPPLDAGAGNSLVEHKQCVGHDLNGRGHAVFA